MGAWVLGVAALGVLVLGFLACAPPAPLPPSSRTDIFLTPDTALIRGHVPRHTTLDALLRANGVAAAVVVRVIEAARVAFEPRRLRASQPFTLERTLDGEVRHFAYEIDEDRFLRVIPGPDKVLSASVLPIRKRRQEVVVGGSISEATPSLFQAMEAAGERADVSIALADILSGEIDFNTELQPGDRFGLAFEAFTREGDAGTELNGDAGTKAASEGTALRLAQGTPSMSRREVPAYT